MSKLTVKSGKGNLKLKKSRSLVGLKSTKKQSLQDEQFVKEQVISNLGGFEVVKLNKKGKSLDNKLDEIRQEDNVDLGTHVYLAEGSKKPLVPTGEIYITFANGVDEEEQVLALDEFKLILVERRDEDTIIAKVSDQSPNPIKVANQLQKASLVLRAEPDLDTLVDEYEFSLPHDDLLSHQWHLQNSGFVVDTNRSIKKGADAKIVDAWKRLDGLGSKSVVVAIIDNGFDLSHPDLQGKIYRPFDLWTQSRELVQGDPSFTHGTPCASIALATSNGAGIIGAAPNAKFMPISGTSYSLRATEQMFDYCIKNGADVISCSWGTTDPNFSLSPMKEKAIARAARDGRNGKGCVIVYAVGNESQDFVSFYSAHPDVIAVAACTSQDEHAKYSNKGREVTVCAPSNGDWPIIAARAWWDEGIPWEVGERRYWRDGKSRGSRYKHFGGTSGACPLVAGVCALILSIHPELTAREVKQILKTTADKIGHPSEYDSTGHSRKYGFGRINADKAIAEAIRIKTGVSSSNTVVDVPSAPDTPAVISSGQGLFRFSVRYQASKGYGVQIGAFLDYANVLNHVSRLESQFRQPVIVNINELGGRTIFKIIVGAFDRKDEALQLQRQMELSDIRGFVRNLRELA